MPALTITVTAAEAARVTNAATTLGYPDAKTMIATMVKNAVSQVEQQQLAATYNQPPIAPT